MIRIQTARLHAVSIEGSHAALKGEDVRTRAVGAEALAWQ